MDFKKFASEAGTFFNRAKQYTEEKLGQAERTELEPQLDNLIQRGEKTRHWTEQLVSQTQSVLQPNPATRLEEFVYEKIQGKKPVRLVEADVLGQSMIDAGNKLPSSGAYGSTLVRVGQTEQKIGQAKREFIKNAAENYLQPLNSFLETDMKSIQKEKKTLESKRLDLDAAKSKVKRTKAEPAKTEEDLVGKAETELRITQNEFDRQCEVTRLMLEQLNATYPHHQRCLQDFVAAQCNYYAQCNQHMKDLQRQLSMPVTTVSDYNHDSAPPPYTNVVDSRLYVPGAGGSTSTAVGGANASVDQSASSTGQKARVLYDYDAADMSELSLAADEVIQVYHLPNHSSDWMLGVRGGQRGKVPIAYINILE